MAATTASAARPTCVPAPLESGDRAPTMEMLAAQYPRQTAATVPRQRSSRSSDSGLNGAGTLTFRQTNDR